MSVVVVGRSEKCAGDDEDKMWLPGEQSVREGGCHKTVCYLLTLPGLAPALGYALFGWVQRNAAKFSSVHGFHLRKHSALGAHGNGWKFMHTARKEWMPMACGWEEGKDGEINRRRFIFPMQLRAKAALIEFEKFLLKEKRITLECFTQTIYFDDKIRGKMWNFCKHSAQSLLTVYWV